ncbi:hypothetical protein ABKN59_003723 [Abortiporus biennis]
MVSSRRPGSTVSDFSETKKKHTTSKLDERRRLHLLLLGNRRFCFRWQLSGFRVLDIATVPWMARRLLGLCFRSSSVVPSSSFRRAFENSEDLQRRTFGQTIDLMFLISTIWYLVLLTEIHIKKFRRMCPTDVHIVIKRHF